MKLKNYGRVARSVENRVGQAWAYSEKTTRDEETGTVVAREGHHITCQSCGAVVRIGSDHSPWCSSCGLSPLCGGGDANRSIEEADTKPRWSKGWRRFGRDMKSSA